MQASASSLASFADKQLLPLLTKVGLAQNAATAAAPASLRPPPLSLRRGERGSMTVTRQSCRCTHRAPLAATTRDVAERHYRRRRDLSQALQSLLKHRPKSASAFLSRWLALAVQPDGDMRPKSAAVLASLAQDSRPLSSTAQRAPLTHPAPPSHSQVGSGAALLAAGGTVPHSEILPIWTLMRPLAPSNSCPPHPLAPGTSYLARSRAVSPVRVLPYPLEKKP